MHIDDDDATPVEPAVRRSSASFRLNLDSAPCARCKCRRDAHVTRGGGSHRWECMNCDACPEFVIGGEVVDYSGLADTQPESKP